VVCCTNRKECVKGHPLYIAALAMNMMSISKGLSPGEEWEKLRTYRKLWRRWTWCRLAVFNVRLSDA